MLTSIDVKFIFDIVCLGLPSSANILQIADVALRVVLLLSMFLAIISPSSSCSSYSWNESSVGRFCFHNQNNSNSCPGMWAAFWRHFLVEHKILPNLVISNWLWWIMRVRF